MQKIFTILAVAFAAFATLAVVGCSKENSNEDLTAELIGSWRGTAATSYTNGIPNGESTYTLTFTKDKLTVNNDGTSKTYSYKADKKSDGTKYFTTDELGSIFYTISGTTMTITNSNTTAHLFLPKTLEKAVL